MWAESSPSNFLTEKSFYNICHQMIISRWRWTRRRRSLARPPASRSRCGWSGHSTTPASTSSTRRRTLTGDPGNLFDRWATIELARRVMDSYHWKHPTSNWILMLGFWCICICWPNLMSKSKIMSPYSSVQMSIQRRIWFRCICWRQTMPNRYIEVEFDLRYFQW